MLNPRELDPDLAVAHTTADAASIIRWVAKKHGIEAQHCHLIRRGLNDNYAIRLRDGTRYVARLYAIRPRGGANADFEGALLSHLKAEGAGVAAMVAGLDGRSSFPLLFPEGCRTFAVFEHAQGSVPETQTEFMVTGAELARIHLAAKNYSGPSSRYVLDGAYLAGRIPELLRCYPGTDDELLAAYESLVQRLLNTLSEVEHRLTRVICHGDTHGFNNHMTGDAGTDHKTRFFDFDDAGPGFLAYDLSVLPWSYLYRKGLTEPDDVLRERWLGYVEAYRNAGGPVLDEDLAAIPLFLQLRHLWNLGEAMSRVHHWGVALSTDWLRKQPERCQAWEKLDTFR